MKFHDFTPQYSRFTPYVGNAVLRLSNRNRGPFKVKHRQVGTHFFNQYEVYYYDSLVLMMYESRGGDYDYLIVYTTSNPDILTELSSMGM